MYRSTPANPTWSSVNWAASKSFKRAPKYDRPAECVSRITPSDITPHECCRHIPSRPR